MNRACQVHTTGFDLPDRRMISAVPQPSAVARITLARHTCFCGALRSATIASSQRRSARVTLTTIPALIMRAWTASADLGIVRMNQTIRRNIGQFQRGSDRTSAVVWQFFEQAIGNAEVPGEKVGSIWRSALQRIAAVKA